MLMQKLLKFSPKKIQNQQNTVINHLLKTVDVEIVLVFENAKNQNFVSLSNAGGNIFVNFVSLSNAGGTSRDKSFV